jgi:epoxyqueuosine reductase
MFSEPLPETPTPRSLILVATPSHSVRMRFTLDGVVFPVMTAPGYLRGVQPKPIEKIQEFLSPFGLSAARVDGPQKTMATISGFARYGRNNISYVDGLGSFIALSTFASDMECDEAPPQSQETLPRCTTCHACREACPTGAISEDRFLLHAERCITFWNEKSHEVQFPDWIEPEWHNALFGCLHCQRVCPENRVHVDRVLEGPTFDEPTTRWLLSEVKKVDRPEAVRPDLEAWRLIDLLDYLPRNLGALVKREALRREKEGKKGDAR